ncbi:MAG TPA: hypothetical protein VGJ54_09905 [Streptosporangiaceae bacterium]
MRYVKLRRRTDNDGDRLTPQGTADAEMIGRGGLHRPDAAFVSTGAARATQMLEILRRAAGQDETPITTAAGCGHRLKIAGGRRPRRRGGARTWMPCGRSTRTWSSENRCCSARRCGGWWTGCPRAAGRWWWATALPTRRPLGLAGRVVPPLGKGQGVLLVEDSGDYQVEPLD